MMKEELGPNLAKTLMGPRYSDSCTYQLLTTADGFLVLVTDKVTGTTVEHPINLDEPDMTKITGLYESKDIDKKFDWVKLIMFIALALCALVVLGVILWRSNMLTLVLHWLAGLTGTTF